jgi:hypothetical protein
VFCAVQLSCVTAVPAVLYQESYPSAPFQARQAYCFPTSSVVGVWLHFLSHLFCRFFFGVFGALLLGAHTFQIVSFFDGLTILLLMISLWHLRDSSTQIAFLRIMFA